MTILSYSQLESTWMQASTGTRYHSSAWAALMAAIALAESGGNPDATNPTDNGGTQTSWGLWQISLGNHNEPSPSWASPVTNAQLAIGKLNSQGLTAWGTYDSGAYKKYLNGANSPLPSTSGSPTATTATGVSLNFSSVTDVVKGAGTLIHEISSVLNFFFEFFQPGQTWRIAMGAAGAGAGFATVKLYTSQNSEDKLPLIFLFASITVAGGYMALRPWPESGGKPIRPAAYAVDIFQGNVPTGSAPVNETTPIEFGLTGLLGIWAVSKAASIASSSAGIFGALGGIIGKLWKGIKGIGEVPVEEALVSDVQGSGNSNSGVVTV